MAYVYGYVREMKEDIVPMLLAAVLLPVTAVGLSYLHYKSWGMFQRGTYPSATEAAKMVGVSFGVVVLLWLLLQQIKEWVR